MNFRIQSHELTNFQVMTGDSQIASTLFSSYLFCIILLTETEPAKYRILDHRHDVAQYVV